MLSVLVVGVEVLEKAMKQGMFTLLAVGSRLRAVPALAPDLGSAIGWEEDLCHMSCREDFLDLTSGSGVLRIVLEARERLAAFQQRRVPFSKE